MLQILKFGKPLVMKSNETYFTRPTFIILNPDELQYYPILVKLDRYRGSCNTLDDLSDKLNVANKTEYVNVNIFHVIKWTNESNSYELYDCRCSLDCKKCNSEQKQKRNNDEDVKSQWNSMYVKKCI